MSELPWSLVWERMPFVATGAYLNLLPLCHLYGVIAAWPTSLVELFAS